MYHSGACLRCFYMLLNVNRVFLENFMFLQRIPVHEYKSKKGVGEWKRKNIR